MTEEPTEADGADYEPDEDDTGEEERRLFGDRREKVTVFVGAELGLTRVEVAADRVGQFSLVERASVNCVAAGEGAAGTVVVATDDAVLVGDGDSFESIGFGPAATVGIDDDVLYAASPDGEVGRLSLAAVDGGDEATDEWEQVGTVADPARFDGAYLAAADGVHRVGESLEFHGLSDVRDVTYDGSYAATADGLYRREEGWTKEYDGDTRAVQARGDAVHAVAGGGESADDRLLARADGDWQAIDLPTDEPLVDLVHGLGVYVLTGDGTLVVEADPAATSDGHAGWRSRALGVRAAQRLAVQG